MSVLTIETGNVISIERQEDSDDSLPRAALKEEFAH